MKLLMQNFFICYPNMKLGRDDQLARSTIAGDAGGMVVIEKRNPETINLAISRLLDTSIRQEMKTNLSLLKKQNGANEAYMG